jgi:hypothetical protein
VSMAWGLEEYTSTKKHRNWTIETKTITLTIALYIY